MIQHELDFGAPVRKPMPEHPVLILTAGADGLIHSYMPDFELRCRFISWAVAMDVALHPLNSHVSVRIRP